MDILKKIDKLRAKHGWSINNLAMEAMLTQSTLNNLYARNSEPKISTLRAICNAFNISLSEFFADDDIEPAKDFETELIERFVKLTEEQKEAVIKLLRSMT